MADSAVTPYVFLDTEVFKTHQLDFQSPNFRRLVRLAAEGPVQLLLTMVTKGEVMDDLKKKAREAIKYLKEVRRRSSTMRKILSEDVVQAIEQVKRDEAIAALQKEFDDFIGETGATVLDLGSVSADDVFKKYFHGSPPFGGQGDHKKVEFPDAFAFSALEAWSAANNNAKIYLVGNDGDWKQMCAGHPSLISVARIDELLQHFTDTEIGFAIKKGLAMHRELLRKTLHAKAEGLDVYIGGDFLIDGEVDGYEIRQVEIVDFNIVEICDGEATVSVLCEIDVSADVVADDPDSWIKDSETKSVHYMRRIAGTVERIVHKAAEVALDFDKEDPEQVTIESVEFEDSRLELFVEEDELTEVHENDWEMELSEPPDHEPPDYEPPEHE